MLFGLQPRRPTSRKGVRRSVLALGVVFALTAATAVLVAVNNHERHSAGATAGPHGSPTASASSPPAIPPDVGDPGDLGDLSSVTPAPPSTVPPLPSPADLRLNGVPRLGALATEAGAHAVNVPILMYHFLRVDNPHDRLGFALSVTPSDFALQLAYLKREGYTSVSLGQVMAAMTSGAQLPKRPVVLTFDDGFANFATVGAPLLAQAGFTATTFVVSGFVNRPQYMTAAQVQQVAGMGMTIGAHTEHHVDLTRESVAAARQEIDGSRTALRALTGQSVDDFAYPAGRYDAAVVQLVAQAGYRDAVTTLPGFREDSSVPFLMPRVRVSGGESIAQFARSLVGASSVAAVSDVVAPAAPAAPAVTPVPAGAAPPRYS